MQIIVEKSAMTIADAAGLLSQQLWCFGQDIRRVEGNWLIEQGFQRTPPPREQKDCASVYTLSLSASKRKRWFVAAERMSCLWRHVQLMVAANAFESAEHESARHSYDD